MLPHDETIKLIKASQGGDQDATSKLLEENTPLIKSLVKRYVGKHVEYDDLFQISSIGLLKAVKNFDCSFNVRFSTYAVPMILGEIKRYMRDDGYLKVSRSMKSAALKIAQFVDDYKKTHDDSPTVDDIAEAFQMDAAEVVFTLDSAKMPVSIYEKSDSDDDGVELADRIASDDDKKLFDKVVLSDMLSHLTDRERKIVVMRFFRDMTQGEIARVLGVSQVQVSRLESKIIEKLKNEYQKDD